MSYSITIDGQPVAAVSARDRGLQFGDGLFETMSVVDGRVRLLSRHLQRLYCAAGVLQIDLPDMSVLTDELTGVAGQWPDAVLKLIVTRGSGSRGYAPPTCGRSRRIVYASPRSPLPSSLELRVCSTRLAIGGSLAGIKHLNRLEQVLARLEWRSDESADDGLMLDVNENVIETVNANLFIVDRGGLVTPPLTECGVAGVMRSFVMELAEQHGMTVTQRRLALDDVHAADEVFVTNSLAGMTPVVRLLDTKWDVGPVTTALAQRLETALQSAG